jgi:DNA-binding NarL/FixJ family response regulator
MTTVNRGPAANNDMPAQRIRILVVQEHPAIRRGLVAALEAEPDMRVLSSAAVGDAIELCQSHPDIVLMDLALERGEEGMQTIRKVREEFPAIKVIVYSLNTTDESIYQAFRAGATTVLSKETSEVELIHTIREICGGRRPIPPDIAQRLAERMNQASLTSREIEVLACVAKGLRNKEIAFELAISEKTVQDHLKKILCKLNVNDRTGAVVTALRRGIIRLA